MEVHCVLSLNILVSWMLGMSSGSTTAEGKSRLDKMDIVTNMATLKLLSDRMDDQGVKDPVAEKSGHRNLVGGSDPGTLKRKSNAVTTATESNQADIEPLTKKQFHTMPTVKLLSFGMVDQDTEQPVDEKSRHTNPAVNAGGLKRKLDTEMCDENLDKHSASNLTPSSDFQCRPRHSVQPHRIFYRRVTNHSRALYNNLFSSLGCFLQIIEIQSAFRNLQISPEGRHFVLLNVFHITDQNSLTREFNHTKGLIQNIRKTYLLCNSRHARGNENHTTSCTALQMELITKSRIDYKNLQSNSNIIQRLFIFWLTEIIEKNITMQYVPEDISALNERGDNPAKYWVDELNRMDCFKIDLKDPKAIEKKLDELSKCEENVQQHIALYSDLLSVSNLLKTCKSQRFEELKAVEVNSAWPSVAASGHKCTKGDAASISAYSASIRTNTEKLKQIMGNLKTRCEEHICTEYELCEDGAVHAKRSAILDNNEAL